MSVLNIKIKAKKDLVQAYKEVDERSRLLIEAQMAKILEKLLFPERSTKLYVQMSALSQEATSNGLTEELIDSILSEK